MNKLSEIIICSHGHSCQRRIVIAIAALLAVILHLAIFFSVHVNHGKVRNAEPGHKAVVISLVSMPVSSIQIQASSNMQEVARGNDVSKSTLSKKIEESNTTLSHTRKTVARSSLKKNIDNFAKQKKTVRTSRKQYVNSGQKKQVQAMFESAQAAVMQNPAVSGTDPVPIDHIRNRKPIYPEIARQRGQEGKVILLAKIDSTGRLKDLYVSVSSGYQMLDEAAVKAVRQWRFKPATKAGVAIAGTVSIPVDFKLR